MIASFLSATLCDDMPFAELPFQTLQAVELIDPWRPSAAYPKVSEGSLLAKALILYFEHTALVCTPPQQISRGPQGTTIDLARDGAPVSLDYRLTIFAPEEAADLFPAHQRRTRTVLRNPKEPPWCARSPSILLLTEIAPRGGAWVLKMRFLDVGWYQLSYRPDLDGAIELAPLGEHYQIKTIKVTHPDEEFGWLHPASPYPFALENRCWRSAHPRDWPLALRKLWLAAPEAPACRQAMRHALIARFRQHKDLRRRLLALRYPVAVEGVSAGMVEEVADMLRTEQFDDSTTNHGLCLG